MSAPPHNAEAEVGVLGAVLLTPGALGGLLSVEGLRPTHFYEPRHGLIFAAMVALHDRPEPVDAVTVCAELTRQSKLDPAGGQGYVHQLPTMVLAVDHVRAYAKTVIEDAGYRSLLAAAVELQAAAVSRDATRSAEAQASLGDAQTSTGPVRRKTREARQEAVFEIVSGGGGTKFDTPFRKLTEALAGGWRPGQFTTLGGHPGHGKSVLGVQFLRTAHADGARCALYTNEMEQEEIDIRALASECDVPYWRLQQGKLRDGEADKAVKAMSKIGESFELIEASGMTADEVAYDIRRERWDVALVDLLNGLPNSSETKDIDHNVGVLTACSRQAGTHIIACQHLNQSRHVGRTYPPEPVASDIRGSGAIYALSNNVLFVYLTEDPDDLGEPSNQAIVKVAKARGGVRGRLDAIFQAKRMRFLPASEPGTVGAAA